MKTKLFTLLFAAFMIISGGSAIAQQQRQVPQQIANFVAKHYGNTTVRGIDKDVDKRKVTYEVDLNDGTELEFDGKFNLIEVKSASRNVAVPASVMPKSIVNYVRANYPNLHIVKWEKERRGYDVELSNGVDLEFNTRGKFVRIDR